MNNFVAKHARSFNLATVQRDRTKFHRPSSKSLMDEWLEEDWDLEQPAIADPKEFETPSISLVVYKRSLINNGDTYERTKSSD